MNKKPFYKHIPNILSTTRLAIAPILPFVFVKWGLLPTLILYLIGDATDLLDGALARILNARSNYGKIVDPIADKSINGIALIIASVIQPKLLGLIALELGIASLSLHRVKTCKKRLGLKSNTKGYVDIIDDTMSNIKDIYNSDKKLNKPKEVGSVIKDAFKDGFKHTKEEFLLSAEAARKLNVSLVGKIKSYALFLSILSAMVTPMGIEGLSSIVAYAPYIFGATAGLQLATTLIYMRDYHQEKKDPVILEKPKLDHIQNEIDYTQEIDKWDYVRERTALLLTKSHKQKSTNTKVIEDVKQNIDDYNPLIDDQTLEKGIQRTKK